MAQPEEEDPLELEHMMGFNGDCKGSVQFHPRDPNVMISYTGCLLVVSRVDDPHQQEFLRGHNEAITCLAISPTGNLIASGQASTTRVPNSEATVIVWDYATRQPVYRLMELHDGIQFSRNRVQQLAFSPDEAFLAGSDDQPGGAKLCIWHTNTAQLATIKKTDQRELAFLAWGEVIPSKRKINKQPSYQLLTAARERVFTYTLEFDVHTMQYKLDHSLMQLPSSGLSRTYNVAHAIGSQYLVAGSSAGELVVFNIESQVFRACVPVSPGGLLALCIGDGDDGLPLAYCGCGDGKVMLLQGQDLQWVMVGETRLDGGIRSLTLSADQKELLAGTSTGNIYRLDSQSLQNLAPDGSVVPLSQPLLASHAKPIRCVGFSESSEWFVTASDSGALRRWELSHYSVDYEIAPPTKTTDATNIARAECLAVRKGSILSGWSDGTIRAYDENDGGFLWEIASAHRGGVSCIDQTPLYLVSGGIDGSVRVWGDGPSRQLLGNFDEHSKRVTGLCVDLEKPNLIHSCADDKLIVTIDLNQARRTGCHSVKEGQLRSMAQCSTGELELITGDTAGSLKWWDCDEGEPIAVLTTWLDSDDVNKERRITKIGVSPPLAEGSVGSDYLLVATASGDLQVWDLEESALVSVGAAHSEEITDCQWAPDGKQIISVGKDACICVWNFYGQAKPPGAARVPPRR